MRQVSLCLGSLLVATVSYAANPNVALNKPVTLNGSFPTFAYVCNPPAPPQPPASNVTNGIFLPEGTCYQQGIYWNSANQGNTVDIDLAGDFLISSATVQVDDNDAYTLQYRDINGIYHDWWHVPTSGSFGLITRPNTADTTQQQTLATVLATGLRLFAPTGSGDGYYAVSQIAVFGVPAPADKPFQVSYAANPANGESYINIINTGANGASLLGPGFGAQTGNICVNAYTFSPDEQEISCCSCLITPNAVANLGVTRDLTSTTLTGVIPTSVVVKLVSTLAGGDGTGTDCTNTAATPGTLAYGMVAYGTTPQPAGATYSAVEHPFVPATLSQDEFASITGRCASMLGNGSGFGVCKSCTLGALGAAKH